MHDSNDYSVMNIGLSRYQHQRLVTTNEPGVASLMYNGGQNCSLCSRLTTNDPQKLTLKTAERETGSTILNGGEAMKVYRVYESFHEPDHTESGTYEYGTMSSLEMAKARLAVVWAAKKYPEPLEKNKSDSGWSACWGYDWVTIHIEEITVDEPIDETNIGYT